MRTRVCQLRRGEHPNEGSQEVLLGSKIDTHGCARADGATVVHAQTTAILNRRRARDKTTFARTCARARTHASAMPPCSRNMTRHAPANPKKLAAREPFLHVHSTSLPSFSLNPPPFPSFAPTGRFPQRQSHAKTTEHREIQSSACCCGIRDAEPALESRSQFCRRTLWSRRLALVVDAAAAAGAGDAAAYLQDALDDLRT